MQLTEGRSTESRGVDAIFRELRERGFSPFPLCAWNDERLTGLDEEKRGKKPAIEWDPYKTRQATDAEIADWCVRFPNCSFGIATGTISGVVVLDVDYPDIAAPFIAEHGGLPETVTARSSRGLHYYFAAPSFPTKNSQKDKRLPGMDVRGDGGLIVVPPSMHRTGVRYAWEHHPDDYPFAELPEWLHSHFARTYENEPLYTTSAPLRFTNETTAYGRRALLAEADNMRATAPGARNNTLASIAATIGRLVGGGEIARADADAVLLDAARVSGLSDREARSVIKRQLNFGMQRPRSAPPREITRNTVTTPAQETPAASAAPVLSTWADVADEIASVSWAWQGWLPHAFATLLVSESGKGKSALALRIAQTFIAGTCWPDGTPFKGERGRVLWAESECGQPINISRAKKWRLPLESFISPLEKPLDDFQLVNDSHLEAMRMRIKAFDVRFVVVDSLSGATSGLDENTSKDMGETVKKLAALATDCNVPVLLLHHLNKGLASDSDGVHMSRVRGSSAIMQYVRAVWALDTPDESDPDHRRLSVIKSNLSQYPPRLGLRIGDDGVSFGQAPVKPKVEHVGDRVREFLLSQLQDGPKLSKDVYAAAQALGIAEITIKRAKDSIGVQSLKDSDGWKMALASHNEQPF